VTRSVFSPAYRRLREWLIETRRARGVSQTELAAILGRQKSFISKYERGERRLDFVEALEIADALEADACALVTELRRLTG
jgi:transcriptional regulator with XRE-family HTH domain